MYLQRENVHVTKRSYELDDIIEAVVAIRRPELAEHSKNGLKRYLHDLCRRGFTLSVLLSAIDEWNEDCDFATQIDRRHEKRSYINISALG